MAQIILYGKERTIVTDEELELECILFVVHKLYGEFGNTE